MSETVSKFERFLDPLPLDPSETRVRGGPGYVVVGGQIGLEKGGFLDTVAQRVEELIGIKCRVFHLGKAIIHEAGVDPAGILQCDPEFLDKCRKIVLQDLVASRRSDTELVLVNTHWIFNWGSGNFMGMRLGDLKLLRPDMLITLTDSIHCVAHRYRKIKRAPALSLEQLLYWRQSEIDAVEFLQDGLHECAMPAKRVLLLPRGGMLLTKHCIEIMARLIAYPKLPTFYPSGPMTHVGEDRTVNMFLEMIQQLFRWGVALAPNLIDEWFEFQAGADAYKKGEKTVRFKYGDSGEIELHTDQIVAALSTADNQVRDRDILFANRICDATICYFPTDPGTNNLLHSAGRQVEKLMAYRSGHPTIAFVPGRPRQLSPFHTGFAHSTIYDLSELETALRDLGIVTD